MSTFRDSLGRECPALPSLYREVRVLGRPRSRRTFWRYAVEAMALFGFGAFVIVLAAVLSR